jgi:hypothetical protein
MPNLARRPNSPTMPTPYDDLLMSGVDRADARGSVRDQVADVLERWREA